MCRSEVRWTRRWRGRDSNPRSLSRGSRFFSRRRRGRRSIGVVSKGTIPSHRGPAVRIPLAPPTTLHSPKVPSRPKKAGAEPLADTGEVCGWQTRDRETLPSRIAKRDGGERPAQLARARTQYRSKGSELWQKMRAVRWRAGVRSYFSAVLRSQPILLHAGCPIAPPATTSRC